MENTIKETLKGLNVALEARKAKLAALNNDVTPLIEEKKAELQKEFDEKLSEFTNNLNAEREQTIVALQGEIAFIEKLTAEQTELLNQIAEKANAVQTEEAVQPETTETVVEAVAVEENTEAKNEPIVERPTIKQNPFMP